MCKWLNDKSKIKKKQETFVSWLLMRTNQKNFISKRYIDSYYIESCPHIDVEILTSLNSTVYDGVTVVQCSIL